VDQRLPESSRLYPAEQVSEVEALEDEFDEGLGVESRRWVYFHWLKAPAADVLRIAAQSTPAWQRRVAPFIFPVFRAYLTRYLGISAQNLLAGRQIIEQAFDRVEARLSDGRPFLCGSRFTAADLTFACMAAPLLLPPEYGIRLPTLAEAPEAARADIQYFQNRSAGKFALRLFAERRAADNDVSRAAA
jgi:glutathione S-transferase